ncbi:MAG: TIGR04282 family arsenosugar biosynthesis glycosyltransferase [Alphaproteobacteria bacterium]
MRHHLVIFAKSPRLGRAKRRLAADIGSVAALRFYRTLLAQTLRRLASDPRWRTWLAVTPEPARWPPRPQRIGQGTGDLGRRMDRAMRALPPGPAVLVGADIPAIGAAPVAAAFRALGRADAVFGPAADGGYWLVGLRRRPRMPVAFRGVRWSGPHALADTVANLAGLEVWRVATLADVDDGADYARWRAAGQRSVSRGISSTKLQGRKR